MLEAGEWALAHADQLTIPLLLMHGSGDRLTSAESSRTFAGRAGSLCTLQIWEGLYHELHFETERDRVLQCICDWIARARVGQAIQYHEGFLMLDRAEATSDLPAKDRTRLHAVARRAWIACELGLIHLFSQRVGDGHYRYFAVRSSTPLQSPDFRTRLRVSTFNPHA